jgi:hypothetical protein
MAWPRCPECGAFPTSRRVGGNLLVVDSGADTRSVSDPEFPRIRFESEIYRSYRCRCGWTALTIEKVITHNPETLCLQRKYEPIRPRTCSETHSRTLHSTVVDPSHAPAQASLADDGRMLLTTGPLGITA